MSTEEITIRVPRRLAQAYRSAAPEQRRKMELYLTLLLTTYVGAAGSGFDDVWTRLGEETKASGLTEDRLNELLKEIGDERRSGQASGDGLGAA
ncbi:MAG: hypothetical protein IH855_06145 [Bacteroidetes bacterium]|nr:hypothetical protein [Bacteroidota bacterium]